MDKKKLTHNIHDNCVYDKLLCNLGRISFWGQAVCIALVKHGFVHLSAYD